MPFAIRRGYSDENKSDFLRGLTLTSREVEPRLGGAAGVPKGGTSLPGPYAHEDSSEASASSPGRALPWFVLDQLCIWKLFLQ